MAEAEFRGFGVQVKAVRQTKEVLTKLPPAGPDVQALIAKTDPKIAQVLLKVDRKPITVEDLLGTVVDVYRLPHTPTAFVTASQMIDAASTAVSGAARVEMKGDVVTITLNPDSRRALESKASEEK